MGLAQAHSAVRSRVRAGEPPLWTRPEQQVRRDDRHIARQDGWVRGLPLLEHLAAGQRRRAAARDRLGARRQQHLGLHGQSDVRRREPGPHGQCRVRVRELPARRAGLLQPWATEDRQPTRRLGQLRVARRHQSAAVRPSQHRRLRGRSGQRHADGGVGRRRERLRLDDVAAPRRCQSGAGAQTAADQRRHFAGGRTARWQRRHARAR